MIRWLLHPGSRLSQRVLHGGVWVLGMRMSLRLLDTLKIIVLARILVPEDFGLMGIALLAMALLETFTQTGLERALVQRAGDIKSYLNTAWTMELLRSLLLAGILIAAAPLLSKFFGESRATPLVQALALVFIIKGLTNIGIVYFQKELEFQKRFVFGASKSITEVGVAITLAVMLHSVWALVFGAIAGTAASVIASYILHPYRPRLQPEWGKALVLFRYGKWVLGSRALDYTVRHLDDLFVGRIVGVAGLGFYRMAFLMSELATAEITHVAGMVLFPAYSKLQERREELGRAYLRTMHLLVFLSFPLAGGFFLLAPAFTQIILGEKWMPMVPALQILIIWGLGRSIGAASNALFAGTGRPDWTTKLRLVNVIFLAAIVYPLTTTWGIVGAGAAILISTLPVDCVGIWLAHRIIQVPATNLFKVVAYPIANTTIMLTVLYFAGRVLDPNGGIVQFVATILLGGLTYLAGILVSRLAFGYTMDGILTGKLKGWVTS